jgi:aminotransferase
VGARPKRLQRLPEQYFVALLGRVSAAAAEDGPPLVDLGRGNPEQGPPPHVVEALVESARRPDVHGYAPIRGLARTREALAARYRDVYGVELDPEREVALIPGTKTGIVELSLALADEGETILLPDPYYPDYPSGPALAGARLETFPLHADAGWAPDLGAAPAAAALYLNYPSNPCAVCAPDGVFADAVAWAGRTGGAVVHDAAYMDLVYDGRRPESFLATPGAKDVGVEMWSMSKTYGMAGWRIGFVAGNAEIVERSNLLNDHQRVGIFEPMQRAAIAALEGPQDSVAERVATYERRRDVVAAALDVPIVCEGTFFVWLRLPEALTAERLLEEHRVAVAPGEGFGPSGAGWARISLAVADDALELGAARLAEAFESRRPGGVGSTEPPRSAGAGFAGAGAQ